MGMLQNNFTTPEQSKQLLELGVSILTADCYYYVQEINGRNIFGTPNIIPYGMGEYGLKLWWLDRYNDRYIPCWSVGRLINIFELCTRVAFLRQMDRPIVEDVKCKIESYILHHKFDFSKLEE